MKTYSVYDEEFRPYGQVMEGYDFTELLDVLKKQPAPADSVVYVPGLKELEDCAVYEEMEQRGFGGIPIQIGYCNGTNNKLNCLEYHRNSELNVAANDAVLLLGLQSDIVDGKLDTSTIKAFLVPAGTGVEVYGTALHYAPCSYEKGEPFRMIVCLPKGTNVGKAKDFGKDSLEDKMLFATNKWLLAHPEAPEVKDGAYVGLTGENLVYEKE